MVGNPINIPDLVLQVVDNIVQTRLLLNPPRNKVPQVSPLALRYKPDDLSLEVVHQIVLQVDGLAGWLLLHFLD